MGNFAENLNLGNRFRPPLLQDVGGMCPPVPHLYDTHAPAKSPENDCGHCGSWMT